MIDKYIGHGEGKPTALRASIKALNQPGFPCQYLSGAIAGKVLTLGVPKELLPPVPPKPCLAVKCPLLPPID